jgi:hypothetical protein
MNSENSVYGILEFASQHPHALLAINVVLIIIIVVMLYTNWCGRQAPVGKKKQKLLENEEEMDELIESIHRKQSKPSKQPCADE